ncbi:hypothetical protein B0H11DRAFT_2219190 [Mycena galericulata]|nr:hypothetical protein B0H11DRAFT_2219190 [Mycena galericulata]
MVHTAVVFLYAKEGSDVEEKLRAKLAEASQVYCKDKETISWFVMQDHKDPRAWGIVERYQQESSLKEHVSNPYYKTFGAYVGPLLAKPMVIHRFNEIDTSKPAKSRL